MFLVVKTGRHAKDHLNLLPRGGYAALEVHTGCW